MFDTSSRPNQGIGKPSTLQGTVAAWNKLHEVRNIYYISEVGNNYGEIIISQYNNLVRSEVQLKPLDPKLKGEFNPEEKVYHIDLFLTPLVPVDPTQVENYNPDDLS